MTVFEELSFDIFFEISKYLSLDDVAHLCQTCRQLQGLVHEDSLSRRVVEDNHAYTEEARQAWEGSTTYKDALCAIYERRYALSEAQPFSALVVGQGSAFLYRQGILCVQSENTIQVSNTRSSSVIVVLDLFKIISEDKVYASANTAEISFEMMYYSDGILAILVTAEDHDPRIYCIKTAGDSQDKNRVIRIVDLGHDISKLFVRHTSQYLYYGSHTGVSLNDGHRKWEIRGVALDPTLGLSSEQERPLLLEDFHGTDIGSTVAFEIHNGFFYAVSNQGTYEVEEIDWTSFYNCLRFPLDDPMPSAVNNDARVYRRQHAEGAIHDSWTDLVLQADERTNELLIIESRREWVGASSRQVRTFYSTRMDFAPDFGTDAFSEDGDSDLPQLPEDDIYTTLLDSSHRANYMPTPKQFSWTQHPEFGTNDISQRSFILARTKFRMYNYSCSAFVDLVEDEECCRNHPSPIPSCLRLRIGSRRVSQTDIALTMGKTSIDRDELAHAATVIQKGVIRFTDKTQYRYTPIRMWPPPRATCPCSAQLHRIMNPHATLGLTSGQTKVTAVCDERSIAYMVKPKYPAYHQGSTSGTLGTIVLIDFGRSTAPIPPSAKSDDTRWHWTPGQEKRCKSGTCR